ncbi:hypothetical protein F4X88_14080 [Candidatus Poribacteria bacterium]|nr:hypothetical protein [Candidatus Poribacteria bacterium]MYA57418.1 hypothetical protein [Candidatus Poribacteria bacterium]
MELFGAVSGRQAIAQAQAQCADRSPTVAKRVAGSTVRTLLLARCEPERRYRLASLCLLGTLLEKQAK